MLHHRDRDICIHGATAIAADRFLNISNSESSIPETSYCERDPSPLEAAEQQRTDQTNSTFEVDCCDESLKFSGQTPASSTASAVGFPT